MQLTKDKEYAPGKFSGRNWYEDRYQRVLVTRNLMFIFALLALIACLAASVALYSFAPLKSVQPFLITVDEKTGITEVVDPMKDEELTSNDSLNQYFLIKYVTARENYNPLTFQVNYETVRLMSASPIFWEYHTFYSASNKASPLSVHGASMTRTMELLSVSFLTQGRVGSGENITAQVRMKITNASQSMVESKNYIALISFTYSKLPLQLRERYVNPLGFQVVSYKLDDDFINK